MFNIILKHFSIFETKLSKTELHMEQEIFLLFLIVAEFRF